MGQAADVSRGGMGKNCTAVRLIDPSVVSQKHMTASMKQTGRRGGPAMVSLRDVVRAYDLQQSSRATSKPGIAGQQRHGEHAR